MGATFWLRWSWRDLRRRAAQVVAIAAIVALGSGVYSGLGSTSEWRRQSLDVSLSRLFAHDVHVALQFGTTDPDRLVEAITVAGGGRIEDVEPRLVVPAPAIAETGGSTVFAAGVLVGVDLDHGPRVDRWKVTAGRQLTASDRDVVLLEAHFAASHDLPSDTIVRFARRRLHVVGHALSPEYVNLNTTAGEAILGAASRAVLFAPLALAQELAGSPGQVNDAVLRVAPGTDPRTLASELQMALTRTMPSSPVSVTALVDDPAHRAVRDEIDSEDRLFDVFALLVLAGAAFAVFNLVRRVVEGQRRDIGIAMSLGVPTPSIAIRPLLLAAEITLIGVVLGVVAGQAIAWWVMSLVRVQLPMPYWVTPFQPALFLRAAALGFVIPVAASVYPVWRAVRVQPVDALVAPHLQRKRALLPRLLRRARLPGSTLVQAPFGRVLRAPTRSLFTVVAIALIIAPLLAALGATDSTASTLDSGRRALEGASGERLFVDLVDFQPASSGLVSAIAASPLVSRAVPTLAIGGYLTNGADDEPGKEVGVSLSLVDLQDGLSSPVSLAEQRVRPGGIVISAKAADDLGVEVGDVLTLRHPRRDGTTFTYVQSMLPVTALHASPYRFVAYMDLSDADLMGLTGIVNSVKVEASEGAATDDVLAELAELPGVASALSSDASARTMEAMLDVISRLFIVLQIVIAVLAFLVAFNTANIGADERAREHATMFAFGVRERRVIGIGVIESLLLGTVGVGLGLGLGVAILRWMLVTVFPAAVPDLAVLESITTESFLVTVGIGLVAVALAPVFNARRLRRMDIPSTLRFVE